MVGAQAEGKEYLLLYLPCGDGFDEGGLEQP